MSRIGFRWLAGIAAVAALLAPTMNGAAVGVPVAAPHVAASGGVKPNAINNMDCNGHSPVYKAVKPGLGGLCTDPVSINSKGEAYRFLDNGQYVGHDEPSVKFISSAAGTANNMTHFMPVASRPSTAPRSPSTASSASHRGSACRCATRSRTRRTHVPLTATPTPGRATTRTARGRVRRASASPIFRSS